MKVSLVVMSPGKTMGQAIPISGPKFIIGRDPQCNLRPANPIISKKHCAIFMKNDIVFVQDFNSTNGTFVNDIQVKGEMPLNHGNVLKVGSLLFRVDIEKVVPIDKPTPLPPQKTADKEEDVANILLSVLDADTSQATRQ